MSSKCFNVFLDPESVEYLDISTLTWPVETDEPVDQLEQIGLGADEDGVLIEPSAESEDLLACFRDRQQPADLYHPGFLDAQGKFHPWF